MAKVPPDLRLVIVRTASSEVEALRLRFNGNACHVLSFLWHHLLSLTDSFRCRVSWPLIRPSFVGSADNSARLPMSTLIFSDTLLQAAA